MSAPNYAVRKVFQWTGSLWFAAVLLVLVLVALACATVFESMHGTEQALSVFYHSTWFAGLLALLGVNVIAAVLVRWPLPRAKWPFAMTHLSLIVIMTGALISKYVGVEGQIALNEGSDTNQASVQAPRVTVTGLDSDGPATIDLSASLDRSTASVVNLTGASTTDGTTTVEVVRFLPDAEPATEVTNDNSFPRRAYEIALSAADSEHSAWLFPEEPVAVGSMTAMLRVFANETELKQAMDNAGGSASIGLVRATFDGTTYEWPVEQCRAASVPLGDTGMTLRVAGYYPHANVGSGGTLHNASDRPENPAIRVLFDAPSGSFERLAFAKFPDFSMRRPDPDGPDVKVVFDFQGGQNTAATTPIELMVAVDGTAYVRFASETGSVTPRPLEFNSPVDTPWPGMKFTMRRSFDHARKRDVLVPFESLRENRKSGVLVALRTGENSEELWLAKYQTRRVAFGGRTLDLSFADQRLDLGFSLTLDDFMIRYYPGTRRPRSFESRITISDPTGDTMTRLVSMNQPVKHNGYSLFQSSYQGETLSILSVSRDPGLPIVFVGYFGLMGGMICVLITRARSRAIGGSNGAMQRNRGVNINLLSTPDRCLNGEPVPAAVPGPDDAADAPPVSTMQHNQRDRVNS